MASVEQETREDDPAPASAREREAALRGILDVISRSRDDEGPVFQAILENAARLCDAPMALLGLLDEPRARLSISTHVGARAGYFDFLRNNPTDNDPDRFISARAMRDREAIQVTDISDAALPGADGRHRGEAVFSEGMRTILFVPLVSGDESIGCVMLYRRDVAPFSNAQISLLEAFAAQAVIAIENVRQFRELQTRLEREKATGDVLDVIARSRDDEVPVFQAILRAAARLCGASVANLTLLNEARTALRFVARHGRRIGSLDPGRSEWPVDGTQAIAEAARTGELVHVPDFKDTALYREDANPTRVRLVDEDGVRSVLAAPLLGAEGPVGVIALHRDEPGAFSDGEIGLVRAFAAQAVIAIENVRQFRELQTRLEREKATRDILDAIARSRDDEKPVFDAILENATGLCDAPLAFLSLVDDDRAHFRVPAHRGAGAEMAAIWDSREFSLQDTGVVTARAVNEKTAIHIEDLADESAFDGPDERRDELARLEGIRSYLVVPMFRGEEVVGTINLYRREVKPFSAEQISLIETFAAQAVIAIENVRQFRELQSRLEREKATGEVLGVISRSQGEDLPVFDVILANACRLCETPLASIIMGGPDDAFQRVVAQSGADDATLELYRSNPPPMDPGVSLAARAIVERKVIHLEDMKDSDAYREDRQHVRYMVDEAGVRSVIFVPLISKQGAIGAIVMFRREVRPFTEENVALISSFAAQAVIAIENARQFRELQTRLEREEASREVLGVISRSRDDERPVFDVILKNAARLCGAPLASLNIVDETETGATLVAHWGERLTFLAAGETVWPMDGDHAPVVAIRENRVIHESDLADTDLYRKGDPMRRASVDEEGIRTYLAAPLVSGKRSIGCIGLYRREVKPFTEDEIALVETFAAQAVIAIENVRQFRELQSRLEREKATGEVLGVISRSRNDERPVFDAILKSAARICKAKIARLHLLTEDGARHAIVAHWGEAARSFAPGESWPLRKDSMPALAIMDSRSVHVDDFAESEAYKAGDPLAVRIVEEEGLRARLTVPLMRDGKAFGCIALSRREAMPFREDDISLVETFAAQAAIAIDGVAQFRELQTRLEREKASREVLGVISRSRDDEQPVFDTILENAARLCRAPHAGLLLRNEADTHLELAASNAATSRFIDLLRESPHPLDGEGSLAAQAARTGEAIHCPDMAERRRDGAGPQQNFAIEAEGMRTVLLIPLLSGDRAVGVIFLYKLEVAPFSEDEIALAGTFAAQAVIAIENVRQFRAIQAANAKLQTRLDREAATREILEVISQSRDNEQPVFDVILDRALKLCGAPLGVIFLGGPDDDYLRPVAFIGGSDRWIADFEDHPLPRDADYSLNARAVIERHPVHIEDLRETDLYRHAQHHRRIAVDSEGMRTALSVPLVRDGQGVGAICLYRREVQPFEEHQVDLLKTFAAQAVIAIENVRQYRALETLNAELGDRVEAQVDEIERIGRLKRFLPAAVADAVVSSGDEAMLASHRALLGILFCDIRGFTAFCERAEPEETIEVLQTYHEEMGRLIAESAASVDHRMGDGIMVLFNDPMPCDDPAGDAVRLALAMRARMQELCRQWKRLGHRLGFGVGVSLGYATVGMVGSEGRQEYTASGTAVNLASRLCDQAEDGEILLSPRAHIATEDDFDAEPFGEITLKGIQDPLEVFRVKAASPAA